MNSEQGKDLRAADRGLLDGIALAFAWEDTANPRILLIRTAVELADIESAYLRITSIDH
jgi:hypothetical protein